MKTITPRFATRRKPPDPHRSPGEDQVAKKEPLAFDYFQFQPKTVVLVAACQWYDFFFFLKRHLSSSSLSESHRKWAFWWPVSPVRFVICPTTCWWAAGPVNLPKTWQWHNFRPDPEARKLGVSVLFFGHCPPAKRCTSRKLESETLHCH